MTPPKMPENNEGIARRTAHSIGPVDFGSTEAIRLFTKALDAKDLLHKDQLEAGKLAIGALETIEKLEGAFEFLNSEKLKSIVIFIDAKEFVTMIEKSKEALEACRKAGCL